MKSTIKQVTADRTRQWTIN